ncbi:MAG: hypothetical protein ACRELB_04320, partial [Polyangiaceae bacterium]
DDTDWILLAVSGNDDKVNGITAADIVGLLSSHGRAPRIDKLRMSSHSRGYFALNGSLRSKQLVAPNATAPILDPSAVERIVSFDSDEKATSGMYPAVRASGVDVSRLFGFWATVWGADNKRNRDADAIGAKSWTIPASQTVNLMNNPTIKKGLRAVEYGRLILEAKTLRSKLTVPPDIQAQAQALKLPAIGTFTTRSGPNSFRDWCTANKAAVEAAVGAEVDNKGLSKMYQFIDDNDLGLLRVPRRQYGPGLYHHHLFPVEFAHEVTDAAPPQTG